MSCDPLIKPVFPSPSSNSNSSNNNIILSPVVLTKETTITEISGNYNYFLQNRLKIYEKIDTTPAPQILFDINIAKDNTPEHITKYHETITHELIEKMTVGGQYLFTFNASKSIFIPTYDNIDDKKIIEDKTTNPATVIAQYTKTRKLDDYLKEMIKELDRNYIFLQDTNTNINTMYKIINKNNTVIDKEKNIANWNEFLKDFGMFLSTQFKTKPYSINFTHEQIRDIKCSNCIDVNGSKFTNINCTLFEDIEIDGINKEDLEDLKKILYNLVIFFQSYLLTGLIKSVIILYLYTINESPYYNNINNITYIDIIKRYDTIKTNKYINHDSPDIYYLNKSIYFFDKYKNKNIIIRMYELYYRCSNNNKEVIHFVVGYIVCVFYIDEYEIEKNSYVYLDVKSTNTLLDEIETKQSELEQTPLVPPPSVLSSNNNDYIILKAKTTLPPIENATPIEKNKIKNYNYFLQNRQKIYDKITKQQKNLNPFILYDITITTKTAKTDNELKAYHANCHKILFKNITDGGEYVYTLNAYKSIMVNDNEDETKITTVIQQSDNSHILDEYLIQIIKEIERNEIFLFGKTETNIITFYGITFTTKDKNYYIGHWDEFLSDFGIFLSKKFNTQPYSINFTHEEIKNIKCNNCFDVNRSKLSNINCTLFKDIEIDNADTEDL